MYNLFIVRGLEAKDNYSEAVIETKVKNHWSKVKRSLRFTN